MPRYALHGTADVKQVLDPIEGEPWTQAGFYRPNDPSRYLAFRHERVLRGQTDAELANVDNMNGQTQGAASWCVCNELSVSDVRVVAIFHHFRK